MPKRSDPQGHEHLLVDTNLTVNDHAMRTGQDMVVMVGEGGILVAPRVIIVALTTEEVDTVVPIKTDRTEVVVVPLNMGVVVAVGGTEIIIEEVEEVTKEVVVVAPMTGIVKEVVTVATVETRAMEVETIATNIGNSITIATTNRHQTTANSSHSSKVVIATTASTINNRAVTNSMASKQRRTHLHSKPRDINSSNNNSSTPTTIPNKERTSKATEEAMATRHELTTLA